MKFDFKQYTNTNEFCELLVNYIPSLGKLNVSPRSRIMNVDRITVEADKNNLKMKHDSVARTDDYDFEEHYKDNEMIDIIFKGFSDIGNVVVYENTNINSYPFECDFLNLKDVVEGLPMPIFDAGDVVIIWRKKRIITLFHHAGYFAHIFCDI